jgi:hypothetical protein
VNSESKKQLSSFQSLLSVCNSGKPKSLNDYHEHTNTYKCCICMNNSREQEQDKGSGERDLGAAGGRNHDCGNGCKVRAEVGTLESPAETSAGPSAAGARFRSRSRYTGVSSRNIRRTFSRSLYELLNKHWTSREQSCGEEECDSFEHGRCVMFRI